MTTSTDYVPPKIWVWKRDGNAPFASTNRPAAGATHDKELPIGQHPFQLYSLGTPNGQKVTILFEELLEAGHTGAEYDAWLINIMNGEQFGSGFVDVNPNSKIPVLVDRSGAQPVRVFESGSILLYLAEKFGAFCDQSTRSEILSWLFWQVSNAPFLGGGFGHFYAFAPIKIEYAIDRYALETKRQLDVLDQHLARNEYIAGFNYSISDMAIWPWYGNLVLGQLWNSGEFLDIEQYQNLIRWTRQIGDRPAVKRGRRVNNVMIAPNEQLPERHSASDFNA